MARLAILEHLLGKRFGIEVAQLPSRDDGSDILLKQADQHVPMMVRSLGATSRVMLESAVVHVAARKSAAKKLPPTESWHVAPAGLCLLVESFTTELHDDLYSLIHAADLPQIDLVIAARRGRSWIDLPSLGVIAQWVESEQEPEHFIALEPPSRNLFTPANLAVFKTILYHGMKSDLRMGDRWTSHPCRSATDLNKVCKLNLSTVTRALQSMQMRGWITWNRGDRIRCVQPELAMTAWIDHARAVSMNRDRIAVAPAFQFMDSLNPDDALRWLAHNRGTKDKSAWAITGWHAVAWHRLRIMATLNAKKVTVVTTGNLKERCDLWQVVPTHPENALFVIEHDSDEHLQAASNKVSAKAPDEGPLYYVDILQAAIDVAMDPAQGRAQAEHIVERLARSYAP